MKERDRLQELLNNAEVGEPFLQTHSGQYGRGYVPKHYKRCTIPEERREKYAVDGAVELLSAFGMTPYYTQALITGAVLSGDYDDFAIVTSSQYGKLMFDGEPVLTSEGWKTHGDLKVGDRVVSPDGKFVNVLHVHPKGYADRIVTLVNGDTFRCHHRHEWVVRDVNSKKYRTMETGEMEKRGVVQSNGACKFRIDAIQPLEGEHKELAVDPYVMGVWLGDGTTKAAVISMDAKDHAVADKCREIYPDGIERVHKTTGVVTTSFKGLAADLGVYGLCRQKRRVEKYIPDDYLVASMEQRLQLLAGLMDTDGYVFPKDGRHYFTTTSKKLRDGVEALISTFGWRFCTVEVAPTTSSSGIKGRNTVYVIGYNPSFEIPCVLPRRRATRLSKQRGVGILSIEPCEPVQGNCITVEGGVYCVGNHLIPTHNSFLMGRIALLLARNGRSVNVAAATADKTTIIMRHCLRAASGAAPDIKQVLSGDSLKKIDKLDTSLSKARLSFPGKGDVQALTLGGMYNDLDHNQAVGRGGVYIIDEAAQVPPESLAEVSRREFSSVDGVTEPLIMISNPHKKGIFYDRITASDDELMLTPTRCVIWMDARTAVEEGRWTADKVMMSDFAKNRDTCLRYLLCELPQDGDAMFPVPKHIGDDVVFDDSDVVFMGIDSAYKGKDKIQIVILREHGENVYVTDAEEIDISGREWIDGVTAEGIIEEVSRIYHKMHCSFACIDIAYAIWLFEGMLAHGCMIHSVNFQGKPTQSRKDEGHYAAKYAANKRSEMHLDLQDLMDNNAIYFDKKIADDISDTLGALHIIRKDDMRVLITPKPEVKAIIGHSPDLFDAILLAIHAYLIYNFDGYRYA